MEFVPLSIHILKSNNVHSPPMFLTISNVTEIENMEMNCKNIETVITEEYLGSIIKQDGNYNSVARQIATNISRRYYQIVENNKIN